MLHSQLMGLLPYVMLCCCLLLTNDNDESGMSVVVCVCCQTVKHLNVFPSVIMHRCKRYVSTILQLAVSIVFRIDYLMGDIKFVTLHPQTNFLKKNSLSINSVIFSGKGHIHWSSDFASRAISR